jgi:nitrite reductase/ring-hydroxylating ferredoxin subunit
MTIPRRADKERAPVTRSRDVVWHRIADADEIEDGRVRTVQAGHRSVALTRIGDRYGALDNRCPHQGGPLGEGSIEGGLLRCPWHGYDYGPLTGIPPPPFSDAPACFPVEVRDDGVYVGVAAELEHVRTVSDLMVETMPGGLEGALEEAVSQTGPALVEIVSDPDLI